jgi:glycerol-3-phosphate O-acyltransferase
MPKKMKVTPISATSLVALALLGVGDQALTIEEVRGALVRLLDYVERRKLPTMGELDLRTDAGVTRALDELVRSDGVACYAEGPEAIYKIRADEHLAAAYYRNSVIHFFVTPAIAELALLAAAGEGVTDRPAAFFDAALRLRDLLKFEFFFPDRERFLADLREKSRSMRPTGKSASTQDRRDPRSGATLPPLSAHRVARPFLESYRVVAESLLRWGTEKPVDKGELTSRALALGKQWLLQQRIRGAESVSKSYFETALRLADNRKLLGAGAGDLDERRRQLVAEIAGAIRRIDAIDALAAARRSGIES